MISANWWDIVRSSKNGGRIVAAAMLGIKPSTLSYRMEAFSIKKGQQVP
jgi:hypothetical protein